MRLYTDRPDFFNDISEEIRLFLPAAELELSTDIPVSDNGDYVLAVLGNDGI